MTRSDRERAIAMSITPLEWALRRVLAVSVFVTMVGLIVWVDRVLWGPW